MPMSVLILTLDLTTLLELHGSCLVSVERLIVKFVEKMFIFRMPCKLVKQFGSSLILFSTSVVVVPLMQSTLAI